MIDLIYCEIVNVKLQIVVNTNIVFGILNFILILLSRILLYIIIKHESSYKLNKAFVFSALYCRTIEGIFLSRVQYKMIY